MSRQHRIALSPARRRALMAGLIVLTGLGISSIGASSAHAQGKRIVVNPYSGSGGGRIASKTAEILQEAGHSIISFQEYRGAARDLDARGPVPANVAKVASQVGFDAVLFGDIDKSSGIRQVTVRVFASDGREVGSFEFSAKRRRLDRGEQDDVRGKLLPIIAALSGGGAPPPRTPDREPDPEPDPDDGLVMEPDPVTDAAEERLEDGDDPGDAGAGTAVEQAQDTESAFTPGRLNRAPDKDAVAERPATSLRGPLDVSAGLNFITRILRSSGDDTGPQYDGSAPGVFVDAEIYPAAFGSGSMPVRILLANIGVRARFYRIFGLSSTVEYQDAGRTESADLGTTHQRFGVGLVYRYFLGDGDNPPVIKFGLGYDQLSFSIDKAGVPPEQVNLPDVAYSSIDPGLSFRYPINNTIAVSASARLLVLLGTGDISNAEEYGDTSSSLGFDVGAEVEYEIIPRLSVRLGAQFTDVTLAFDGNGMKMDIDGTTDFYIGGYLTAGYRF